MEQCILTLGTVTRAIRARKLLSSVGISARLTKAVRRGSTEGCAYSLELSPTDMTRAIETLEKYGIRYEWSRGER